MKNAFFVKTEHRIAAMTKTSRVLPLGSSSLSGSSGKEPERQPGTTGGMGSHQSAAMKNEVWLTPPHILQALGPFDLDPCAAPNPRPWDTAAVHWTKEMDGLAEERRFFGRVWMNPPYGRYLDPWLAKLADHGVGTALIFARTDTAAFCRQVWERASACLFLEGRLHFHVGRDTWFDIKGKPAPVFVPAGGAAPMNGGAPSVLVAYGAEDCDRLYESGLAGHFVPLAPTACLFMFQRAPQPDALPLPSWREILIRAAERVGQEGRLTIQDAYRLVEEIAAEKIRQNPHWREKVRQTLNRGGFERVGPGQYQVQAKDPEGDAEMDQPAP